MGVRDHGLLCHGVFDECDALVLDCFRTQTGLSGEAAQGIFRHEARRYIRRGILEFFEIGRVLPSDDANLDHLVVYSTRSALG